MASNSCKDVLDHPEVLDREDLIIILHDRCIPLQEINNLDKEKLVSLFYKYVSPLPQRIHQLRRAKREPQSSTNVTNSYSLNMQNPSRKRFQGSGNHTSKVKIPKSDLEHVLINNGSSKRISEQATNAISKSEVSSLSKSKPTTEVNSKPVKLNRKSLNLELNSLMNDSTSVVNRKSSHGDGKESHNNQYKNNLKEVLQDSSHSSSEDVLLANKKFKKIAISWP